jgi:hypothetical protein
MYASERQLARLRLAFLRAVLSQEIGACDTDLTSGKIISGISNHISIIQEMPSAKRYAINSCSNVSFTSLGSYDIIC